MRLLVELLLSRADLNPDRHKSIHLWWICFPVSKLLYQSDHQQRQRLRLSSMINVYLHAVPCTIEQMPSRRNVRSKWASIYEERHGLQVDEGLIAAETGEWLTHHQEIDRGYEFGWCHARLSVNAASVQSCLEVNHWWFRWCDALHPLYLFWFNGMRVRSPHVLVGTETGESLLYSCSFDCPDANKLQTTLPCKSAVFPKQTDRWTLKITRSLCNSPSLPKYHHTLSHYLNFCLPGSNP